jgi:hypothetical protein
VIKSRRVTLTGYVAGTSEMRNVCKVLVEKPKEKRQLGGVDVDVRIILEWILKK